MSLLRGHDVVDSETGFHSMSGGEEDNNNEKGEEIGNGKVKKVIS